MSAAKSLSVLCCAAFLVVTVGWLGGLELNAGGNYPDTLPDFTLKDPADKEHSGASFKDQLSVFIITIPNVKHGDYQKRWSKWIIKQGWPDNGAHLVMVQDMSQTGSIKEKAREGLKKAHKEGKNPVLLLDESGSVRRQFQVMNDETVVLVFDKNGRRLHYSDQEPTQEEAQKIRKLVDQQAPSTTAADKKTETEKRKSDKG